MKKLIMLLVLVPMITLAHSGRTDSSGGHNCSAKSQAKGLCSGYHSHGYSKATQSISKYSSQDITKRPAKEPTEPSYNRKDWKHWTDYDKDCQNTRHEVLIRDSIVPVTFKKGKTCTVATGLWYDRFTTKLFKSASDIDIDHIVPLKHANTAGGFAWAKAKKKTFANDPENLLPVEDNINSSKGDKAPHEWMPPNKDYWCTYIKKWNHIKTKYNLAKSQPEISYILAVKVDYHCY